MLLLLLQTLAILGPDIPLISAQCTTVLTSTSSENVIQQSKHANLNCEWIINSSNYVELNVTYWSLDDNQDTLTIYDGSLVLAELCGRGASFIAITSGQTARVTLQTGPNSQGDGFGLTYRTNSDNLPECHHHGYHWTNRYYLKATETPQILKSRNYPGNYPENLKEEWVIIKPTSTSPLSIVIEDMDIEPSKYNCFDYLEIHDGKCATDKRIAKVCGHEVDSWTIKGHPHVLIRFRSDSQATGRGFKLKYYVGTIDDSDEEPSALHSILIGLIAACICVIFLLVSAKIYIRCFKRPKVLPNQAQLQNRRAMLEAQVRRGQHGSRLSRLMTAQSIHAELTRYFHSTTSEHNSRVSTFEISTSQASGQGLVYENGMYAPPSYSTLFNNVEPYPPAAGTNNIDPPPYPGSPTIKQGSQGQTVCVAYSSPVHGSNKPNDGLADVETVPPPPYHQ